MLRFLTLAAMVAVALSAPQSNFIFKNDITPEEAQEYLKNLPFSTPKLAGRTAVLPLVRYDDPRFRAAEAGPTLGHYWKNGHEIENTDDYVEEVYNAAQYHGQDGLGQYAYGYETPESSKVEDRQHSGDVRGSYVYQSPGFGEVQVRYYADSEGFHQEDNLPKVELKPAEETPALREARLAFEKAWKEAAEANSKQPIANFNDPYQTQASENEEVAVAPEDSQPREGKALAYAQAQTGRPFQLGQYNQQQQFQQPQYFQQQKFNQQSQYSQQGLNKPQFGQQQQYSQQQYGQGQKLSESDAKTEEPEPTGPPHGFFYSFDYPVSIIKSKKEQENPGYPVDHDTVGINNH